MKVTKALKLIKRSHKVKVTQDLFNLKYPPLLIPPGFVFPNHEENERWKAKNKEALDAALLQRMDI